jgi:hypothetical protein
MEDRKPNLEADIYSSEYIKDKAYKNDIYCQHLYATLCNNEFVYGNMLNIVSNTHWSCSWRHAGGIAANLYENLYTGDYMRYYTTSLADNLDYITEGMVDEEIRFDLQKINWYIV